MRSKLTTMIYRSSNLCRLTGNFFLYAVELHITTNSSEYTSLNITLANRTWVTFKVRAVCSATVGLSTDFMNYTDNFLYELVLGVYGWNTYYTQLK